MRTANIRRLGETILIACIVAFLTGLWAHQLTDVSEPAHNAALQLETVEIARSVQAYYNQEGRYPEVPDGLAFCEPFRYYNSGRCLGELVGEYMDIPAKALEGEKFVSVYYPQEYQVVIAANIPVEQGVATSNRCLINNMEFWCIKLPR